MEILDEKSIRNFNFEEYQTKRTADQRTLLHLACESGAFKLMNACFNKITRQQFKELEKMKTIYGEIPLRTASFSVYGKKFEIFKRFNCDPNVDDSLDKDTVVHKLVKANQTRKLRILLEFMARHCLIDTIGFSLVNGDGKTPLDLATEDENTEAIFLLNHYELNEIEHNYDTDSFSLRDEILNVSQYDNLVKEPIVRNQIRNLIFQGGGVIGIGK